MKVSTSDTKTSSRQYFNRINIYFCIDYDNHPNGETITFRDSDDQPQSRVIDLSKDGGQLLQNGIHM